MFFTHIELCSIILDQIQILEFNLSSGPDVDGWVDLMVMVGWTDGDGVLVLHNIL